MRVARMHRDTMTGTDPAGTLIPKQFYRELDLLLGEI